jgi:hypothetical protein
MRPVMHGDLTAMARHLLTLPADQRPAACMQALDQADAADRFRKRLGRTHPRWGNGTLMARARVIPLPREPALCDPVYAACLVLVLQTLLHRRCHHAATQSPRLRG